MNALLREDRVTKFICSENHPWTPGMGTEGGVVHVEAHEVGEQENGYPGGDIVTYECPVCKTRWRTELPQ
jgi:hypothetical protein